MCKNYKKFKKSSCPRLFGCLDIDNHEINRKKIFEYIPKGGASPPYEVNDYERKVLAEKSYFQTSKWLGIQHISYH